MLVLLSKIQYGFIKIFVVVAVVGGVFALATAVYAALLPEPSYYRDAVLADSSRDTKHHIRVKIARVDRQQFTRNLTDLFEREDVSYTVNNNGIYPIFKLRTNNSQLAAQLLTLHTPQDRPHSEYRSFFERRPEVVRALPDTTHHIRMVVRPIGPQPTLSRIALGSALFAVALLLVAGVYCANRISGDGRADRRL